MGRLANLTARVFHPFEGGGSPYPIAFFRLGFFAGICLHFFPSLIYLDEHYSRLAIRTAEWNHWLFDTLPSIPHSVLRAWSIVTMLACLTAMAGIAPRMSAVIAGIGLYSFASFNGIGIQTLALIQVWAILILWALLGGGNAVLSIPSALGRSRASEPKLLPALVLFQVLLAVFFAGIEKLLAGWPLSNELRVLFSYPRGSFVRDWVTSSTWLASPVIGTCLSWATLIAELGSPLLMLFRRTRVPALLAYEAFFLAIVTTIAVPPLFYFIFAFGGLLSLDDGHLSSLLRTVRRPAAVTPTLQTLDVDDRRYG